MSEIKKMQPKVRFKEFAGENAEAWEQRKLGEISTFINGRAYKQNELLDQGKYKVLRVGNFYTNDSWYYSDLDLGDKYYAEDGDLLYTWSATFGPHIWHGTKVIYHYHIWKVELSNKLEKNFAVHLLEYDKAKITSDKNGSTMVHITKKGMENKNVLIPSIQEQKKISAMLDRIDDLITLHQRELDNTKQLKSTMLSKMFPKDGSDIPEFRFAGFTDPWEQRKVSEIADRYDNLRVPITASSRVSGSTPYYGANGIQDYVEGFTHDGEYVLVAEDGANNLKDYPVKYVKGRIWVNNHAHVLQAKREIAENKFLSYALKQTNIEPFLVGGGRAKLNADVLMKLDINVPDIREQIRVGLLFENLDNLITLHQRELETYQTLKQTMLDKMFV